MIPPHLSALGNLAPGTCFLCQGVTPDPKAYLHAACALTYQDEKQKRTQAQLEAAGVPVARRVRKEPSA